MGETRNTTSLMGKQGGMVEWKEVRGGVDVQVTEIRLDEGRTED